MSNPTTHKAAATARFMLLAVAVVASLSLMSCRKELQKIGAIYTCDDYTVYPDSFSSPSLTITAYGDSMIIVGNSRRTVHPIFPAVDDGMMMRGSDSLINYLFNRATERRSRSYDIYTPYEIYATECFLAADSAAVTVDSRIIKGDVASPARGGYRWPVVMSDATWGLAASAVSSTTVDSVAAVRRAEALKRLVERDIEYVYDGDEGLFKGVPVEMDAKELPDWINAGDAADMLTLEGNVSRVAAMRYVNAMLPGSFDVKFIEQLSSAIRKRLWIPNLGFMSQTLYQTPDRIAVTATDNLAQAHAVISGATGSEMSRRIISHTPMREGAVPLTYPEQGLADDGRRSAVTTAMWCIASAMVGNEEAWALSFSAFVAKSIDDDYAARLLKGVVLRTVFGLNPRPEGLSVHPMVHQALGDVHAVTGLRYRDATLNITVRGKGSIVSTINLDGSLMNGTLIDKDIKGEHDVEVILAESKNVTAEEINVSAMPVMPPSPSVRMEAVRKFVISSSATGNYIVYLDGAISEIIARDHYELYATAPVTSVCFEADVANQVTSYASRSHLYIPATDSISIPCTSVAHTGGRVLAKKDLAAKHVESTRYKNARLTFVYEAPSAGLHYIRLRYMDGLGIVNPARQYAIRQLWVNGRRVSLMVLPQRSPQMWTPDVDWAEMTGVTNPVKANLIAGDNEIVVEYFAPDDNDAEFDHDANTVIPLALEIIKK